MVEMALVLPIFISIVLGIIEFGQAMMVGQLVTNVAREASRQAILDGSTNTAVQKFVEQFLLNSAKISSSNITVTITVTPATGNTDPANILANTNTADLVTVQVAVPFNAISYTRAKWLETVSIRGQASMRHE